MALLIGKRVRNGQSTKDDKKNVWWKEEDQSKTKHFLKTKWRQKISVSNDTGWIHAIRVHDTIHSVDSNRTGQQTLMNYSTQKKNERFVKHRARPCHSYIVNSRNKGEKNSEWQEPANPNPGRPRNRY